MPGSPTTSVQRIEALLQFGATSVVLREAFFGVRRFDQFQRNLEISRSVLTRTLKFMVEQGLLQRRLYQNRPDRYEYRLSESGIELYPMFLAMKAWGDRWLGGDAGRVILHHELCGKDCSPRVTCDRCGKPVHAREVRYRIEPPPADDAGAL
ncbi:helix-turn-helix domain-containing protein [Microbacterium kribbense]|uniref:Helix-turn-helix domain-containing protein n=1 Tax=Microbacterium kribbense TaxID=433645 RepID=A0ABP7G3M5_9MICO